MTRFAGKVALVTGAASGIGRAVTLRLASEGASVLAVDIDGDALARTVSDASGGEVVAHTADVRAREHCIAAVDASVARFGRLDVLGNIAGVIRGGHFTDMSEADYRLMMTVNVDGCFFLAQAAIPHLLETGGNIVNMASNAGLMGQAYTVVYCMTKGAVVQLTRALAMEYVKTPLRVNAIAPGGVDTPLSSGYQPPPGIDWDLMRPYVGFRAMSSPEEIAGVFAFVASDDAKSMHGAIVSVDSALTA